MGPFGCDPALFPFVRSAWLQCQIRVGPAEREREPVRRLPRVLVGEAWWRQPQAPLLPLVDAAVPLGRRTRRPRHTKDPRPHLLPPRLQEQLWGCEFLGSAADNQHGNHAEQEWGIGHLNLREWEPLMLVIRGYIIQWSEPTTRAGGVRDHHHSSNGIKY